MRAMFRGRRYRKGSQFVLEPQKLSTRMDRNQRAKLLLLAEQMERASKPQGKKNGALGYTGLRVLRALLLTFHNRQTGLCIPSYFALQTATGLSKQAISDALGRLERAGLLQIVRRIIRKVVERRNPRTGLLEKIITTVQTSNLYRFVFPTSGLARVANLFTAKPKVVNTAQQLSLFSGVTVQDVESVEQLQGRLPLPKIDRPAQYGLIPLA